MCKLQVTVFVYLCFTKALGIAFSLLLLELEGALRLEYRATNEPDYRIQC